MNDEIIIRNRATDLAIAIVQFAPKRLENTTARELMRECYEAVALADQPIELPVAPVELVPAVPIRKSVTPEYIVCLEDGKKFKSLKRHLRTHFNMTPDEYRQKWGLPADYPMVAPNYSATRSKLAKDSGLGTKK